jgi:hypothetical protein
MKVQLIKEYTQVEPDVQFQIGSILEVGEKDARRLIEDGYAVEIDDFEIQNQKFDKIQSQHDDKPNHYGLEDVNFAEVKEALQKRLKK